MLAHDFEAAARREPSTLEQGLAHFAQDAWEGIELDVDLKTTGYERRVVDALREYGLAERALISTMEEESLRVVRAAGAGDPPGLVGARSCGATTWPTRSRACRRCSARSTCARCSPAGRPAPSARVAIDAVMSHWALVTPRLARAVERAGGELYVWTVDDATRIAKLDALGVTGIITNDPRLFATA